VCVCVVIDKCKSTALRRCCQAQYLKIDELMWETNETATANSDARRRT
jgi:hypothetical protein